ncbi:unnamed protein product [Spirodela intermedia]|uniref:Uncharacterized protein n=2 Tax=Spirodela intermedia TaxID=51605 RepID=A0A7I8JRI3_SPIIN|nr:unnamed protein product [Spirodela intermedia]CAA6672381.1 unnamed protein product [Spirodela intermedia]CAA7409564.1 unnamed protein product [Spirodela intermedia]
MVARLTPDQKVACSIHVGFNAPGQPIPTILFVSLFLLPKLIFYFIKF